MFINICIYSKRSRAIKEINSSDQSSDVEKYKLFKILFEPQDGSRHNAKPVDKPNFGTITVDIVS